MLPKPTMSEHQLQILRGIAQGHIHRRIAFDRGIAYGTLKNQLTCLYNEIGAFTAAHVVAIAFARGWLRSEDLLDDK